MTKELPILFSAPMVRAILDGSKTQTRRIVKPSPKFFSKQAQRLGIQYAKSAHPDGSGNGWIFWSGNTSAEDTVKLYPGDQGITCPYGRPKDLLWVRETWQHIYAHEEAESWEMSHIVELVIDDWMRGPAPKVRPSKGQTRYNADEGDHEQHYEDKQCGNAWPWRPSIHMPRWASRITLEVESVRVERLQAISEADSQAEGCGLAPALKDCKGVEACGQTFRAGYAALWESINGPGSWDANPFVWCITFKHL